MTFFSQACLTCGTTHFICPCTILHATGFGLPPNFEDWKYAFSFLKLSGFASILLHDSSRRIVWSVSLIKNSLGSNLNIIERWYSSVYIEGQMIWFWRDSKNLRFNYKLKVGVSDVTISVQQESLTKLEFVKLQVMVQKQTWSYLGKKDNCTLWNYCNNLYITYIVLKLGESTGMLISVRMLQATIESYYLPFGSFYTVYDIELLLHHGFVVIRALDCRKSDLNLSWRLKGRHVCRLSR